MSAMGQKVNEKNEHSLGLVDILRLQACITKLDVNRLLPRKRGLKTGKAWLD